MDIKKEDLELLDEMLSGIKDKTARKRIAQLLGAYRGMYGKFEQGLLKIQEKIQEEKKLRLKKKTLDEINDMIEELLKDGDEEDGTNDSEDSNSEVL